MRTVFCSTVVLLLFFSFNACKKSSSTTTNNLSSINGSWQTTVWGGSNDTAIVNISASSANGTITYLSSGAKSASSFSTGDVIFTNISSTGNSTFSLVGIYRYGSNNSQMGHANGTLTLQNSTTLLVHYSADPNTGITPPDYYWYKVQ
ncbi:MAG TPA: hypothetical protein VMT76_03730 [Puia sp.]|nr:hypothetical protein [Puia sp.]